MSGLIDSIVGVLELLLQGAGACALTWYLVSLYHPVSTVIVDYSGALWNQAFKVAKGSTRSERVDIRPYLAVAFIVSLYAWGVVSNAFNYWLLRPIQDEITAQVDKKANPEAALGGFRVDRTLSLIQQRQVSWSSHDLYLQRDVAWRNKNLKAHESILPSLRKFLRIIRGAVVGGACMLAIALIKLAVALVTIVLVRWQATSGPSRFMFRMFVSHEAYEAQKPLPGVLDPTVKKVAENLFWPNLVLGVLGTVIVLASFWSYVTVESEYQALVMHGATAPDSSSAKPSTTAAVSPPR